MISKRLAIKGLACASQRQFQQISQAGLTGVSAVPFLLVKLSFSTDNRKAKYSTLVFWLIEEAGPQISILSCWLLILLLVAVAQTMKGWDTAYFWELVKAHPESQPPPAPVHKQRYPCNLPHLDIWEQFRFPFVGHPSSSLQVPSVRKWKVGEEDTGKKQMSIIENRVTLHCQSLETTSAIEQVKRHALHLLCLCHWLLLFILRRLTPHVPPCSRMTSAKCAESSKRSLTLIALTCPGICCFDMTGLTVEVTFLHVNALSFYKHN